MQGMKVSHAGRGEWIIESPSYSPTLRRIAHDLPGMSWQPSARAWTGYIDSVAVAAERLKEADIRVYFADDPYAPSTTTNVIATKGLRDYQVEGVNFLVANAATGALLADDMGLGKSAQCLRAMRALRKTYNVVVCPSFVRGVWAREAAKWWPDAHVVMLTGTKPLKLFKNGNLRAARDVDRHKPVLFVINYDVVHAWLASSTLPQEAADESGMLDEIVETIAFDEGHYLQSDRSRRSVACRALARSAVYRIMLTGTPMTSRPRDLWNPVDTISEGRFGKAFPFYLRYANARKEEVARDKVVWKTDGASNLDELRDRMKHFMLRRTKSDVKLQLPPRTRQIIDVPVPKGNMMSASEALTDNRALRKALDLAADGKLPQVIELVESHAADEKNIVVFCHRRVVAEIICDSLRKNGVDAQVIHGGVSQKARDAIIKQEPRVIVATLDSTAVGIDLSFYDVAVFAELDWVPSKLLQGEARLHRFGQKNNVLVQYIIAMSTADEIISATILAKLDVFEKTIGVSDDGLKKDLGKAGEVTTAAQLKSLYEKILQQGAAP